LTNKESIFTIEDTMQFDKNERKVFEDSDYIPTEEEIRKRMTRIAKKAMQYLKKLKVPTESIFSQPKMHRALKIRSEAVCDGGFQQTINKISKEGLKPVIVAGMAFYLDDSQKVVVPMSPSSTKPLTREQSA
jgi:hypothetical protein